MADRPAFAPLSDRGRFWKPVPDWTQAAIERARWTARPVSGLCQALLAGDVDAGRDRLLPGLSWTGLWQMAAPDRAAIRIARDKALLVGVAADALPAGWQDRGWTALAADDGWFVIDIAGEGAGDVAAQGTAADLHAASPSAAILFAGVSAVLYRIGETTARLHVERPFATYIWHWLDGID